ncbi:hypothetical protein BCO_0900149 (plasmid) [Borrelia coriaceae ATCC 43381]|uniref:Uncharacterized protein n=1 Tax=Borrelia coriaceae ATCC 43381 TaxID=1408429 RepID=W5SYC5_9SPIR|nr:hypothetical protein BCO_0900149 [Borrelia coriaceae ATCC 43381]
MSREAQYKRIDDRIIMNFPIFNLTDIDYEYVCIS